MTKLLSILVPLLLITSSASALTNLALLKVKITGVKNSNGSVLVSVFDKADGFPKKADQAIAKIKVAALQGSMEVMVPNLKPGFYALAIAHDENNNGKVDSGAFGIPKEGFGFSRDAMDTFGPPEFDEAKIEVAAPTTSTSIKMKHF